MRHRVFAAAASAALLLAPAAQATDLCTFLRAAVADLPNNFASLAPDPGDTQHGIKPAYVPEGANNCGAGDATHHYAACFWVHQGMTAEAATAELNSLSSRAGDCLGSGYQRRGNDSGGVIFADNPNEDRAGTSKFQDEAGAWEIYVMVVGHGVKLK